jgi:hypothetical protein
MGTCCLLWRIRVKAPKSNDAAENTLALLAKMKHTLSVLVEDEAGVLTRIAGLFARRGLTSKASPLVQLNRREYPELQWLFREMTE